MRKTALRQHANILAPITPAPITPATGPKTRETDFALDGRWHDGSCQVLPPVDGTQKIANPAGGSTGPPG